MPGPTHADVKRRWAALPHRLFLERPGPDWPALDCYTSWLTLRHMGDRTAHESRDEYHPDRPKGVTFGFRDEAAAMTFRRFVDGIAGYDRPRMLRLREALDIVHAPTALKPHSSW